MDAARDPYTEFIDRISGWLEFLDVLDAWTNTTRRYWDTTSAPEFHSMSGRYGWWSIKLAEWIQNHSSISPEPLLEITRMVQAKDPLGEWTAFAASPDDIDRCLQRWRPYNEIIVGEALQRVGEADNGKLPVRIRVLLEPPQVIVDNTPISLTNDEAQCLNMVIEAAGNWVSGTEINKATHVTRPDRALKSVRGKLSTLDFLETSTGKGTRVSRAWLE